MKKETTKQRIVSEAVKLFSKNGYEAVTVEQIATAVGIKAPSLYKHYKSKKEIFESILERMNQMDFERAQEYGVPEGTMDEMAEKYAQTPLQKIMTYSEAQFLHWTEDAFSSAFRRMLTIEQFRSRDMSERYQKYLGSGPTEYMADLFTQMTKDESNGMQLALEFYSPMFLLYSMYDASTGPAEKKKITAMLHRHIDRFAKRLARDYGINKEV
ncbi:MAG: helix-turn-helix domain containing protein [Eubacteriaceae bacterium]|jgi:AcrR family transcriptional regulator|nr:helix-turn-helix domain containing protein [Eubacteriaceae bacterium]